MAVDARAPAVNQNGAPQLFKARCTKAVHGLSLGFPVNQTRAPQLFWGNHAVHGLFLGAPVHPLRGESMLGARPSRRGQGSVEGVSV